jgi:hypothetical protein
MQNGIESLLVKVVERDLVAAALQSVPSHFSDGMIEASRPGMSEN